MPKTQKTTKKAPTKTAKKPAKKSSCEKKSTTKACKCEPETHSLKNLVILWICLFSAVLLAICVYSFFVPSIKKSINNGKSAGEIPATTIEEIEQI